MKRLLIILSVLFIWAIPVKSQIYTDARDGNTYQTVTALGSQIMIEPLQYLNTGRYYSITDHSNRYYTYAEAQGVCPVGWHVASDGDWKRLSIYFKTVFSGSRSLYQVFSNKLNGITPDEINRGKAKYWSGYYHTNTLMENGDLGQIIKFTQNRTYRYDKPPLMYVNNVLVTDQSKYGLSVICARQVELINPIELRPPERGESWYMFPLDWNGKTWGEFIDLYPKVIRVKSETGDIVLVHFRIYNIPLGWRDIEIDPSKKYQISSMKNYNLN